MTSIKLVAQENEKPHSIAAVFLKHIAQTCISYSIYMMRRYINNEQHMTSVIMKSQIIVTVFY